MKNLLSFSWLTLRAYTNKGRKYRTNRERAIHAMQMSEMAIIGYYLWFIVEFCIRWYKHKDNRRAYLKISLVREARYMAAQYRSYGDTISARARFAWLEELCESEEEYKEKQNEYICEDEPNIKPAKRKFPK